MIQCAIQTEEALSMIVPRPRVDVISAAVIGCLCVVFLAGCGGGDFGSELSDRPKPRVLVPEDGSVIHLPKDGAFLIAVGPTQETPGLGGTANADTHVSKEGNADATAVVENRGSALAGFQLGHALKNGSERQMELLVRVRCEFETSAEATPPGPLPDAKIGLKLYARDGRNRLLRNLPLAQQSTEEGAASSKDRKDVEFTITLGPGESVSIFLAGSVKVDTPEGHSARGSIKLSGLEMDVETRMAPAVQKVGDEQG
jgi:hypothetical protein